MGKLGLITSNQVLQAAFLGWVVAQAIKVFSTLIRTRRFDFERLMGSGGMPSSHASTVIAASVVIGQTMGYDSPVFGLALVTSFVVMYDACGIRRAAGKQAEILNSIVDALRLHQSINYQKKLKELLGHTYFEVFAGAVLGVLVGLFIVS
ncbi:MAG: divergent PAP2 family protein [Vallitaleaceae bacterium]|jgi:acid phosphatase family membrane protein YuiD|nr:divergent PAP2 family protein [Vallitaleaceae bacterium]